MQRLRARPADHRVSRRTQAQRSALLHQRPGTGESIGSEKVGFQLAAARVCWWVSWNARTMHRYKPWRCFAHCFACGKNSLAATRISRALAQQGIATLRLNFTQCRRAKSASGAVTFVSVADIVAAVLRIQNVGACLLMNFREGQRPSRRHASATGVCAGHFRRQAMCFRHFSPARIGKSLVSDQ